MSEEKKKEEIMMDISVTVDKEGNILEYETLQYEDEPTTLHLKTKIPFIYQDQIDKFYVVMDGFTPVTKLKDNETIDENRLKSQQEAEDYYQRKVERVRHLNKMSEELSKGVDTNFSGTYGGDDFKTTGDKVNPLDGLDAFGRKMTDNTNYFR
ncbi:hypothetical protein UFVDC4_00219 [Staphylococcus phage vB_SauM-UFV_DC4]|nr:hypothetical protein UFVDC4_00219 [Staphylococcus phage vB_SauM-UFV_DC4]BDE75797.1 hypothetical protein [Staphylococcus phage S6]